MTKKIFIFNGSRNLSGNSERYIDCLTEQLTASSKEDVIFHRYNGQNLKINTCEGCLGCFGQLRCHLDRTDDFDKVKQEIEDADFIIFSSPVFMHNVNATMKNFIDRLAYWGHIFKLRGKFGMIIVSASTNGIEIVEKYQKKILRFLGISVVCTAKLSIANNYFDEGITKYVKYILKSLNNSVEYDPQINPCFLAIQAGIKYQNSDNKEYQYWEKHNMLQAKKFTDSFEK